MEEKYLQGYECLADPEEGKIQVYINNEHVIDFDTQDQLNQWTQKYEPEGNEYIQIIYKK